MKWLGGAIQTGVTIEAVIKSDKIIKVEFGDKMFLDNFPV